MVAADAHRVEPPDAPESNSPSLVVVGVNRSKVKTTRNERTPLLPKPEEEEEEEVYPLPWFRSPEWTRRPPPVKNPGRRRRGEEAKRKLACPSALLCCYNSSASDAGSESDVELGNLVRRPANAEDEADSFKQCIQFLVGFIVIMAMALILLIIFQPKPQDNSR